MRNGVQNGIRPMTVSRKLSLETVEVVLWYFFILLCLVSVVQLCLSQSWALMMIAVVTLSMFEFASVFSRHKKLGLPLVLRWFLILFTVGFTVYSVLIRHWDIMMNGLLALVLLISPLWLRKRKLMSIPSLFQIVILIYLLAAMYFGEVQHFYYKFRWWDVIVHLASAPFIAYAGFLLVYTVNNDRNVHKHLSPFFLALFAFSFSLIVGVAWEVFEYGVDSVLGVNMQKARNLELVYGYFDTRLGVLDTMEDLLVDALGALIVSMIGYRYLKKDSAKAAAFWKIKDQFIEDNPHFFK